MNIGFFTDTYFPQVSGVATSICTLRKELENLGHVVYIFTTTDPKADVASEERIIRLPSVPFISFTDRRIVVRGMLDAYLEARNLNLGIIHTHTEFGLGILGKLTAQRLKIPVVHTWHTNYEDYLHYIAKGRVIRQVHVKLMARLLLGRMDAIVCPSENVVKMLRGYGFKLPMRVISTGIDLANFVREDVTKEDERNLRNSFGVGDTDLMLLTLSRLSYEKNIQILVGEMPKIFAKYPSAHFVIVGDGPYRSTLERQARSLNIEEKLHFTGMVPNKQTAFYYHAADYFVNASTSETQGLTYIEALASGTQCVLQGSDYLEKIFDQPTFGRLYYGNAQFVEALSNYVEEKIPKDEKAWDKKLYEISSKNFGISMYEFYLDMIIRHDYQSLTRERNKLLFGFRKKFPSLRKFRKRKSKTGI